MAKLCSPPRFAHGWALSQNICIVGCTHDVSSKLDPTGCRGRKVSPGSHATRREGRASCSKVVQEISGNQSANAVETPTASRRPLLVYDGDCGFCGYWARYWQKLTGDSVDYRPYQEVAAQYPAIPLADFQRAVQYITPDGHHASAAEASFLTLSHARGKGIWLALYRKLPGFAAISELAYAFIAAHRSAFYRSACFCGAGITDRRATILSHSCSCACLG